MNVFNKVALQGLKQNRSRTFVTVMGVLLSAALITAIATFGVTLQTYMTKGAIMRYGDWHISYTEAEPSFVGNQRKDRRVEHATAFENRGYALLEGGINADKPYLFIAGFNDETFETLPVNLLSGRWPENENEILIPAHVASNGGVKFSLGDTVTLRPGQRRQGEEILNQHDPFRTAEDGGEEWIPGEEKTYTVIGFYQRPSFEERSAPGYTVITKVNGGSSNSVTAFITLKDPYELRSYMKSVQGGDSMLNDNVLRFMGLSEDTVFNTMLYSVGVVLILLIMTGSVFMIYNAFHISLNERTRQFGVLMSVGATARQLRASVLFEGLCIAVVGIPLGMAAALPSVALILSVVESRFSNVLYNVPMKMTVSPVIFAVAAGVSLITILISAYIPARKAARIPVMECIRQTGEIKVEAKAMKTSKWVGRFYGVPGTLALKNFKRNKRRYRSIILSLAFSVVIFVSAGAFGIFLKQTADQQVVDVDYDISFAAGTMEEEEFRMLYDNLKTVPGVYDSSCGVRQEEGRVIREMTFRSHTPGQSASRMKEILEGAEITAEYTLHNYQELLEQNRNMLFIVHLFSNVFAGMMALIAAANVINTISTNIRLRRRELAMIRSIGMGDRDFNKMMRSECMFYGMRTLLLALPAAGILSYLIYLVIGEGHPFAMPWKYMGISLAGVFLIIFVTTWYAVKRVRKENIIDAVRDDMA